MNITPSNIPEQIKVLKNTITFFNDPDESWVRGDYGTLNGSCHCLVGGIVCATIRDNPEVYDESYHEHHSEATCDSLTFPDSIIVQNCFCSLIESIPEDELPGLENWHTEQNIITLWNDDYNRTRPEVIALLQTTITKLEGLLPQETPSQ